MKQINRRELLSSLTAAAIGVPAVPVYAQENTPIRGSVYDTEFIRRWGLQWKVFCDGEEVESCTAFDCEAGTADYLVKHEDRPPCYLSHHTVRGEITVKRRT